MRDVLAAAAAAREPAEAEALVGAARHGCTMLRTLPPIARPELAALPAAALLRHNDLWHAAGELLLLQCALGGRLRAATGGAEAVAFWAEALTLRAAAGHTLSRVLDAHAAALAELAAGLDRLRGGGEAGGGAAGLARRKAVRQLLHSLSRAGRQLAEALPPPALVGAAGALLGGVCGPLAADLLARRDIGADESRELAALLAPLAEEGLAAACGAPPEAAAAVAARAAAAASSSAAGGGGGGRHRRSQEGADAAPTPLPELVVAAVRGRCAPYRRLAALLGLLDARLAEIVARWESGALRREGLARRELEALVGALFEDTVHREQALGRIASARV